MFPEEPSGYKSCFVYFIKTTHLYQLRGRRQHCLNAFSTVSCLANVADAKAVTLDNLVLTVQGAAGGLCHNYEDFTLNTCLFIFFFINFGPLR